MLSAFTGIVENPRFLASGNQTWQWKTPYKWRSLGESLRKNSGHFPASHVADDTWITWALGQAVSMVKRSYSVHSCDLFFKVMVNFHDIPSFVFFFLSSSYADVFFGRSWCIGPARSAWAAGSWRSLLMNCWMPCMHRDEFAAGDGWRFGEVKHGEAHRL